jgi:cell division protein ZapE
MALLKKYRALVDDGVITPDPAQSIAADHLDGLARRLRKWRRRTGLVALLLGKQPAPKGLYMFGAVGRGKTMLMDLFFQTTTFRPKRRIHFHEFMGGARSIIFSANAGDPIPRHPRAAANGGAASMSARHRHRDAMILGRLFKGLFERQVVVVATSNVPPSELYKDGLNRQLFLPFIDLIEQHMQVEELQAAKDFRLEKLSGRPLYFTPVDAKAEAEMDRLWLELTGLNAGAPVDLDVKGRTLMSAGVDGRGAVHVRRAVREAARHARLSAHRASLPHRADRWHPGVEAGAARCGAAVRQPGRYAL